MRAVSATLIDAAFSMQGTRRVMRDVALAVVGTGLLTLSAKVQVPMIVPMTLQTLVVLMIGAAFGARLGAATVLLYLIEGAAGLPVFAGTPEKGLGLAYMMGPTGGFLLGFVASAFVVGFLAERGFTRTIPATFAVFALGHAVIFAFGYAWLASLMGASAAFVAGVAPFYAATAIKTALGAALMPAAWAIVKRVE
jgi:biotin transport system substrate-specific component